MVITTAAKHHTMQRTKNQMAQNVTSAEVEKPWEEVPDLSRSLVGDRRHSPHTHRHTHTLHHLLLPTGRATDSLWPEECGKLPAYPPTHQPLGLLVKVPVVVGWVCVAKLHLPKSRTLDISYLPREFYRALPSRGSGPIEKPRGCLTPPGPSPGGWLSLGWLQALASSSSLRPLPLLFRRQPRWLRSCLWFPRELC